MKMNHTYLKTAALLCTAILVTQFAVGAQKGWAGGGGDDNWSTPGNWSPSGSPAAGDDVVFTKTDAVAISGGVNNIVDAAFLETPRSLQYLNTNSLHRTSIAGSLTITGSDATPYPLFTGSGADDGATAKHYSTIEGDSLTVNNPNSSIIVRQGSATSGAHWSHVDLSGLNTFTANVQSLLIAYEDDSQNQNRRPSGRLILAKTNYITCTSPGIGYQIAEVKQQAGQPCTNLLGQVNYFNVNSMRIGGAKFGTPTVPTRFSFKPGLVSPSVTFRDATGAGRQTAWYIGDDFTTYNSSGNSVGIMDLSGGTVDALVDTIYAGRGQQYCVTYYGGGNGTLTFNAGTIDVNTLEIGYQAAAGSSKARGMVNVNGTALLSVNESLRLAHDIGMGASSLSTNSTGFLNINGGTVQVFGNVVDGGGVATVTITNNGRLDLQPSGDSTPGDISVDTLNLGAGTLANYGTLSFTTLNVLSPATEFMVLPGQGLSAAGRGTLGLSSVNGNLALTNANLLYELADPYSTSDRIDIYGSLTLTGVNIVDVSPVGAFGPGTYTLMTCNSLTGDASNLKAGGVLGDSRYTPSFDVSGASISLTIGGTPLALTWSGGNNANTWDVKNTANWNSGTEKFFQLDSVTFDDTGSVSPAVNVVGGVFPGTVTFNGAQSYTLSGAGKITGGASIVHNSSGTLTILTTNDNVGAIDINGGALQIGNGVTADGALGTGPLNLNYGGLILNSAGAQSIANALSGYGQITKRGPGVAVLSGASASYQGSIVIEAGTLQAGSGTAMGGSTGGLTNTAGGTLDIGGQSLATEPVTVSGAGIGASGAIVNTGASQPNALQEVTLAGNTTFGGTGRWDLNMDLVSGFGLHGNGFNLIKTGDNQVSLYNASVDTSYDLNLGQIEVQAGILSLQGSLALGTSASGLVVRTNAMLDLCNLTTNAITKALTLDDGAFVRSRSVNVNFTNLCVIDGPVSLGGTVTFDNLSGNNLVVNGAISGSGGLIKTISGLSSDGTGTLILNGNNVYTGDTLVNNGTLMVNGTVSQSAISVASGAAVRGTGAAGASLTVNAGGTLAPGTANALGTLSVVNTATLQGDTKIRLDRAATPMNDALSATTIGLGGTLTVNNVGPMLKSGDSFKLFSGTLSGAIALAPLPPLWTGLSWNTDNLATLGTIAVTGAEIPPQINATIAQGSFNIAGTGGMPGVTYYVLTSTNVAEPFNNWIPVSTNVFDASGNFNLSIALDPAVAQNFYRIEVW